MENKNLSLLLILIAVIISCITTILTFCKHSYSWKTDVDNITHKKHKDDDDLDCSKSSQKQIVYSLYKGAKHSVHKVQWPGILTTSLLLSLFVPILLNIPITPRVFVVTGLITYLGIISVNGYYYVHHDLPKSREMDTLWNDYSQCRNNPKS